MLTAAELKSVLRAHGLRLTKRRGQHYLVDARVIQQVVERCELSRDDTVVEIGPGLGALTEPVADRVRRLIAVEVDRGIAELLAHRLRSRRHVEVVCQDILDFPWETHGPLTVVGAIPYCLTTPLLVACSAHRGAIQKLVLILQREVAKRLAAKPGTKAYGRLSLLGQYCWETEVVLDISRHAFFPPPRVDSCCVRLTRPLRPPVTVADERLLFDVVKAAFSQRRKTLVNCLVSQTRWPLSRGDAAALITSLGLDRSIRGEALSLGQFAALTNALLAGEGRPRGL